MRRTYITVLLLVALHSLPAGDSSLSMGFQAGFATTGSIVDMSLELLSLSVGFNVPLGYSHIAHTFDADPDASLFLLYTLSGDATIAIPFGENLILKAGMGAIALTDLGPRITGVIGSVFKAEYWLWESNTALFISVLIPVRRFEIIRQQGGGTQRSAYSVPGLEKEWPYTSSIGLLYGY
ncbi:MAG: hypothetical protein RBR15_04785 [Sphaerochaeta sp.]|nr:hypothetical protein [Sphaerochaeta sp.]